MEKKTKIIFLIIIFLVVCMIAISVFITPKSVDSKESVTITDMVGRNLQIPKPVDRIVTTSPTSTALVYMLAPDQLKALNFEWTDAEKEYVPMQYQFYSNIGGWFGSQDGIYEEFIAIEPDFIFEPVTPGDKGDLSTLEERQSKMGNIPVVGIYDLDNVENNSETISFVGKLIGQEDKAKDLITFNDNNLNHIKSKVQGISDKKTVYYAEGNDGLQTDGSGSPHAQLIDICGGDNVADSVSNSSTSVSIEQVIKWNPDVIITTDTNFYNSVYDNPEWSSISAVKNHEVYLSPQSPFKWFDKPTGVNMIMGVPWVAKILYPDEFADLDLVNETQYFYSNFYHTDLSKDQATQILTDSGLKKENL